MEPEERTVRRAQGGDPEAFGVLVREHEARLFRLARQALRSDEEAADAVQSAFLKAWQRLAHLRDPAAFPHWLTRILINETRTVLRRRHPEWLSLDTLPELPAAENLSDGELRLWIRELPGPQRLALILRYVYGYGPDEIGAMLGTPSGTIRSRLHRAVRALRRRLGAETGR